MGPVNQGHISWCEQVINMRCIKIQYHFLVQSEVQSTKSTLLDSGISFFFRKQVFISFVVSQLNACV